MKPIRAVIVDDEKPARDRIRRLLAEHADVEIAGEAADVPSAIALLDRERPDLCFLDIQMPGGDAFDVIKKASHLPRVIFTTAWEQYAVRAFAVNSLDYLLKPFDRRRFAAALQRAREALHKEGPPSTDILPLLQQIQAGLQAPTRLLEEIRAGLPGAGPHTAALADPGFGGPTGPASRSPGSAAGAGIWAPGIPAANQGDPGESGPPYAAASRPAGAPLPPTGETAGPPAVGREAGLPDRIAGKRGGKIVLLDPRDIMWFEAEDTLVFGRTRDGRYLVGKTVSELEEVLEPAGFFRSHRGFLVNLSHISEILPGQDGHYRIVLKDEAKSVVLLSRRQARRLRSRFPW